MAKTTIHPKTGGAAIGGATAVLLVAIANSIHHFHVPGGVADAFLALLPVLGAYLTPSPDTPAARPRLADVSAQPVNQGGWVPELGGIRERAPEPAPVPPTVQAHRLTQQEADREQLLADLHELIAKLSSDA